MWEWITGVGSILGLLSGIYLVWDRTFRDWPSAHFHTANGCLYLRVVNPADRTLVIDEVEVTPADNLISIGADDRMTGTERRAKAHYSTDPAPSVFALVQPHAERLFRVSPFGSFFTESADTKVVIKLFWRSTRRADALRRHIRIVGRLGYLRELYEAAKNTAPFFEAMGRIG